MYKDEATVEGVALKPMTIVLIRRGDSETHMQWKTPREDRGRDLRDLVTSPGTPGPPEVGRSRKEPPLEPAEEARPWDSTPASRLGENNFLLF